MEKALPAIPAKRYFTIGEVSELCGVKPYVLRYWEQEFTQLKPMKRRGNRRYYQHHEVLLIRRIRELLYEQGFTISGARNRLAELQSGHRHESREDAPVNGRDDVVVQDIDVLLEDLEDGTADAEVGLAVREAPLVQEMDVDAMPLPEVHELTLEQMRRELLSIRELLVV